MKLYTPLLFSLTCLGFSAQAQSTRLNDAAAKSIAAITAPSAPNLWRANGNENIHTPPDNSMKAQAQHRNNFTLVTLTKYNHNSEVAIYNKGYEHDPELGQLLPNGPCEDCYELLDKRTATQKYFVKEGTNATQFILQSSSVPVHYKDAGGKWKSVHNTLEIEPAHMGVYRTHGRALELTVNTVEGYMTVSGADGSLSYNKHLELIYTRPDGTEQNLGTAKWNSYTIGDDGMRVKDAWPGIDIEVAIMAAGVKTSFVINSAMPAYAVGKLSFRDHMQPATGTSVDQQISGAFAGTLNMTDANGNVKYSMQKAIAFEANNKTQTTQDLSYKVGAGNLVDIEVPGDLLNNPAGAYPLVIDPLLVSGSVTAGFSYGSFIGSSYCDNTNNVTIPAGATLSDLQFIFTYYGVAGSSWSNSGYRLSVGGCLTTWSACTGAPPSGIPGGACGFSSMTSIWSIMSSCMSSVSCTSYNLPIHLHCSQTYGFTSSCAQTIFATAAGFDVNVYGTAPAAPSISPAGPASMCSSSTLALTGTPSGGTWTSSSPGVASVTIGGLVTASGVGTATITYTAPGTCALNATKTITVVSGLPAVSAISAATTSVCTGNTITMSDITAGGIWSSTATGIATVSGGNVTGVAAGTATISYTVTNACGSAASTKAVTVNTTPSAGTLSGSGAVCMPSTTTLTSSVTGGTWTSASTPIATVGATSGIVSGVATGTALITYTVTSGSCFGYTSTVVTVGITPTVAAITGASTMCEGASITLADATTGGSWSSSTASIASVGPGGNVAGVNHGAATISYSISNACGTATATQSVYVTATLATPGIINTFSGTGWYGYAGDGGLATSAWMERPCSVGEDASGNVYIADYFNNAIRKVAPNGIITTLQGAINVNCLAVDTPSGYVFYSDVVTNTIRKVSPAGSVSTFIPSSAGLSNPSQLCFDASGNLYCADSYNKRVVKITPSAVMTTVAGNGLTGYTGDGGDATAAAIDTVEGIAVDKFGNLYISEVKYSRIRKVNTSGIISTFAGTGVFSFSGDGGAALSATFKTPVGLAIDTFGNVYVGDFYNYRVRKIDAATNLVSTVAGNGTSVYSGGVPATSTGFTIRYPYVNAEGALFIPSAEDNRVLKVSPDMGGDVTGSYSVCISASTTLSDTTTWGGTGTWSSSTPTVATIGSSTGIVNGLAAGTATITYTITNSCGTTYTTRVFTVVPVPAAGSISGASTLCQGSTTTLTSSSSMSGGYTSSSTGVATVDWPSGIVTGISAGTVVITFTVTNSCGTDETTKIMTVNPLPSAGTISGDDNVCIGSTVALASTAAGGTWASANTSLATINSLGVVSGLTVGTVAISYTVTTAGCSSTVLYGVTVKDCPVTGVDGVSAVAAEMYVLPNPNTGTFSVVFTGSTVAPAQVVITNIAGQKVAEFNAVTSLPREVKLNEPAGVYFITATSGTKSYMAKVILTK